MFERFTEDARQVVVLAMEEARGLGHDFVAAEHLALGVARVDPELLGVDEGRLRGAVVAALGSSLKLVDGWLPFRPEAQAALEHALAVALECGGTPIRPAHVALALLEQEPVRELVQAGGGSAEEIVERLARPAPGLGPADEALLGDLRDAGLLLEIVARGGPVAAWLREHGIDEQAIRERYRGLD